MEHLRHTDQSAPVATSFFPPRLERVLAIVSDRRRLLHARSEPATRTHQRDRIYERNLFLPSAVRGLHSGRSPYTKKWPPARRRADCEHALRRETITSTCSSATIKTSVEKPSLNSGGST